MDAEDDPKISAIADAILQSYRRHGVLGRVGGGTVPSREVIWGVVEDLLRLLFPGLLEASDLSPEEFAARTVRRIGAVAERLRAEVEKGLTVCSDCQALGADVRARKAETATLKLLAEIPALRDVLASDIEAAYEGDPAAQCLEEIVIAYPGLQAVAVYRLAHVLHADDVPLVPRVMTEYAHSRTGIDIHPGARIGKRFFIDHGTGVVIGETCTIGDNVKIYQGVTLGARSFPQDERGRIIKGTKRHPDIEEGVTIYSGATILGTVRIGAGSIVGGNVWLTQSIPSDTRIVVRTPQQMHIDREIADYQI